MILVITGLETQIAAAPLEEVLECLILINQRLSQIIGVAIRQPRESTALPLCQLPIQGNVVMALLTRLPGRAAHIQTALPHEAGAAKLNRQASAVG